MGVLKNPRHELYAQALASGKTASEAIVLAGFKSDARNSSRLTHHEDISRRVAELLQVRAARTERKHDYDTRWVIEELIDIATKAKAAEDYSAANNALKLLGMEKRMFKERIEQGAPGDFDNAETPEQLKAKLIEAFGVDKAELFMQAFDLVSISGINSEVEEIGKTAPSCSSDPPEPGDTIN